MAVKKTTWRGVKVDTRTAAMLTELAKLTGPTILVDPSQGSYSTGVSASAGTHAGGGAVDLSVGSMNSSQITKMVRLARQIGFAAWFRPTIPGVWGRHVHMIAIGQSDLSAAAKRQVDDYRNGRNGLAGHGPDTGPDVPFTTWEKYLAAKGKPAPLVPYPGKGAFVIGKSNPAVTQLGKWLIAAGFNKHHQGAVYKAGPRFSSFDKANMADFQHSIGLLTLTGTPGPVSWAALQRKARKAK